MPSSDSLVRRDRRVADPYHAVAEIGQRLVAAGFVESPLDGELASSPGGHFVRRGGALIAWRLPDGPIDGFVGRRPLRFAESAHQTAGRHLLIGRVGPARGRGLWRRAVEQLARSRPRDCRPTTDSGSERRRDPPRRGSAAHPPTSPNWPSTSTVRSAERLLLNPQTHVNPLWALGTDEPGAFADHLAGLAGVAADEILAAEVMAFDTNPVRSSAAMATCSPRPASTISSRASPPPRH
ncbi:MAG: hypothetical protein R2710_20485 [Acidimicrobiales bacterium]